MNHRIHLLLSCLAMPLLTGYAIGCGNESHVERGTTSASSSSSSGAAGEGGAGGAGGTAGAASEGGAGGAGGMGGGCKADSDCPASDKLCIVATCQTDGTCAMMNAAQGLALPADQQTLHDCKLLVCDGNGSIAAQPDDTDIEDDNEVCTIDACNASAPVHEPAAANTDCSAEGPAPAKVCGDPGGPNAGKCVECNDASGSDQCPSHLCTMNACAVANCMDNVQNGAETDIDCGGGTCPACPTNSTCATNADCAVGTCTGGVCNTTTCTTPLSFTVPGCMDLAAGKPATASGAYPGYPITAGNDGVCSSAWNAGGYGGYWQVDLGTTQSIRGVSFAVAGTPPSTVTATISVSTDGMTFTDKLSNTVPDPGTITAHAFDFGANTDARYVRFTLSSPASWVDIYEANVWRCP